MKKLLSLILSITMLTSVAQLSAFADITAPVGTTEDNPVSVESSLQDETENVAEVTDSEPVLYSTLEQESAKLISLTAEETGFKLTDSSDNQATANAAAEQTATEPVTSQATEPDSTANQPAGVTKVNGNMLKAITRGNSVCNAGDSIHTNTSAVLGNEYTATDSYKGRTITGTDNYKYNTTNYKKALDLNYQGVMPGIRAAITTTTANDELVQCDNMIPQGMCAAGKYLLVSAYCKDDNSPHHSVIYVLDNSTKSPVYLTTIVLPTNSHVGGIAYDGKRVWVAEGMSIRTYDAYKVCTGRKSQNLISCFDFNALELQNAKNYTNSYYAPSYEKSKINLPKDVVPDCLTYDSSNKLLCVGEYIYNDEKYKNGTKYYLQYKSRIARYTVSSEADLTYKDTLTLGTSAHPCNRIQGMAFVGSKLILTRSWDRKSFAAGNGISLIDIYDISTSPIFWGTQNTNVINTKTNLLNNGNVLSDKVIEVPPMIEGVVYDPDINRIYVMFESASKQYIDATNPCQAPTDRILALDISNNFADDILNIGAATSSQNNNGNSEANPTDSGFEEIILDQSHSFDSINKGGTHNGLLYKGGYVYQSLVPANKVWLVNIRGNFDLAGQYGTNTTKVTDGFLVKEGATLIIQTERTDYAPVIRRNPYVNDTWKAYLGDFIRVEKGANLIISSPSQRITFQGGNINKDTENNAYTAAEGSVIRTYGGDGDGTSNWNINGFNMFFLMGKDGNDKVGLHPYDSFNEFVLKNCTFKHILANKNSLREGSAIFLSSSYNAKNTVIDNLTFSNDLTTDLVDKPLYSIPSGQGPAKFSTPKVEFDAIRFEGISTNFSLTNSTFKNTFTKQGTVGFVNYNYEGQEDYSSTSSIGTLNIKKTVFENCVGTANSSATQNYDGSTTKLSKGINHYFGPLTFATKIDDLNITNGVGDSENPTGATKFTNCTSFHSGGIAFDRNANITKKAVLGSEKQTTTNNRKSLIFDNCTGKKNAGAIGIYGKINQLIVGDATINGCKSTNGSAIMIYGSTKDNVKAEIADMKLQYTDIRNCVSKDEYDVDGNNYSGTVRSTGSAACKLTVDHCNITDNYVWKDGGGIYWNAMGKTTDVPKSSLYITDSVISNNTAAESGGGIYCEADITGSTDSGTVTVPGIVNTVISDNEAGKDGGGICQTVYDNSKETSLSLTKTKLALGENVEINNNLAKGDGGGVAFILRDSANIEDVNAASNYSLTFEISDKGENSAVISNNQAEFYGGGVYYGTGSEITTNDGALGATAQAKINNYTKSINLYAGKINHNKANSHGGGIYSNSGAIIFKKGEIDNNEAGADVTVPSVAVDGTISEKSLTNGNGGGGAVFVINGGSVTVYNGFIRNNKAFKHNSDDKNTAFQGNTYDGVGGGICVANGAGATDDKRSKFTLTKETADQVYNVGIYSNEADFAADDVYASGKYTKLDVPKVGVMNLTDYKGKATGWFEDYNNGDTKYAQYGTSLAEETEDVGSRYRRNIQKYPSKYKIPDVSSDPKGDMITNFVNTNDNYVCMTLGAIASTSITNNIKVPDLDNLGTYKSVSGTPHDVALKYTITRNDGGSFTANDLVFDIDGKKFDPGIANTGNTFSFYLKDGETINFPNMSDGIAISVKVEYVKSINGETIYTTGKNISYVAKTDNKVVTDGKDGETSANTTSEIITTDGNKVQTFTFDNVLMAVRVKINFFDRNTDKNGTPADIKSNATTYNKDFIASACEQFFSGSTSASPIKKMITATGVEVEAKYKNVVDDYHLWTSQTDAENGIKKFATEDPEYKNLVSKKYSDENNYKFHSNHYGSPTSENWLTYTTVEGNVKSYEQAKALEADAANIVNASKEIGRVNVWLFNTPKKYEVKVYEAPENSNEDNMTNLNNGKFIFNGTVSKTFNAYYNQRIGTATNSGTQDEGTDHLGNYGLGGIIKDSGGNPVELNTAKEINIDGKTYKFSYWSFDAQGKTVASTNYGYNYRITTDTDLYPVYEETPMRWNRDNVGVTTTANQIDVFFDNQGVAKTRLNTVINPYNCDDNDSRISHVSAIYIIASKNATVDKSVIDGLKKIIHKYYTDNSVTSSGSMDISTLINNDSTLKIKDESGKEVTIKKGMYYVYTKDAANLTNKNRTEFTLTFDTSALINRRLLAFTAMKFNNDWKVSDNCYDYSFDVNGAMNEVKNITSVY